VGGVAKRDGARVALAGVDRQVEDVVVEGGVGPGVVAVFVAGHRGVHHRFGPGGIGVAGAVVLEFEHHALAALAQDRAAPGPAQGIAEQVSSIGDEEVASFILLGQDGFAEGGGVVGLSIALGAEVADVEVTAAGWEGKLDFGRVRRRPDRRHE